MRRIFLITGHSARNGGASYYHTNEWLETKKILNEIHEDRVITVSHIPSIREKVKWLKTKVTPQDVVIELHLDAAKGARGATVFHGGNEAGAQQLLNLYCKHSKVKPRKAKFHTEVRHGRLGIIADQKYPQKCFLLELGFISNYYDLKLVRYNAVEALKKVSRYFILGDDIKTLKKQIDVLERLSAFRWIKKFRLKRLRSQLVEMEEELKLIQ